MAKQLSKKSGRMSVIEKSQKVLTPKVSAPSKKFTFSKAQPKSTKNSEITSKKQFTFGAQTKKYQDVKSRIDSNIDQAHSSQKLKSFKVVIDSPKNGLPSATFALKSPDKPKTVIRKSHKEA